MFRTHIFVVIKGVEHVVGQAGEEVDDEPRLEVVHADDLGVADHLATGTHECRVEVEHNVDEEDDVHDGVHHEQTDVLGGLVLEGDVEGHHDGGVEGETQDGPVPDGLEGAVVEQDVGRRLGRLLAVLRQDVRVQRHHLPASGNVRSVPEGQPEVRSLSSGVVGTKPVRAGITRR